MSRDVSGKESVASREEGARSSDDASSPSASRYADHPACDSVSHDMVTRGSDKVASADAGTEIERGDKIDTWIPWRSNWVDMIAARGADAVNSEVGVTVTYIVGIER